MYAQEDNPADKVDPLTGTLSPEMCGVVVRSLGMAPSDAELKEVFGDHGGPELTLDKLKAAAAQLTGAVTTADEVIEAFKVFDKDKTGKVAAAEIRLFLNNTSAGVTEEECDDILLECDPETTGQVDYETFTKKIFAPL